MKIQINPLKELAKAYYIVNGEPVPWTNVFEQVNTELHEAGKRHDPFQCVHCNDVRHNKVST
jgi:hypothetical protein